ncbi:MAG: TAXI family TRAP transporter solute-binding subunit [Myxococcales bacterium]|nr:TAXI family TRAP transporter solute-binding subunit [Myxococcales bacterium]
MKSRSLKLLVLVAALLACAASAWFVLARAKVETLRFAAGPRGGEGFVFAEALSRLLTDLEVDLRLDILETEGAVENLEMLEGGRAELAAVQNDVPIPPRARTIAYLYPQMFHLIVRADSDIRTPADLAGKRVGTTQVAGASSRSLSELLAHYGLTEAHLTVSHHTSKELVAGFLASELDAVFRTDRVGEPGSTNILTTGLARLVPVDQGAAMRLSRPYLESHFIPKGAYRAAGPVVPEADLPTVGVQTVFLARVGVDDAAIHALAELLLEHRRELSALFPAGAATIEPAAAAFHPAVHPGAAAYFARNEPGFLVVYSDVIALLITLAGIAGSVLLALRSRLRQGRKDRSDRHSLVVAALITEALRATTRAELDGLRARLYELFPAIVAELDRELVTPEAFQTFSIAWQAARTAIEDRGRQLGA